MTDRSNAPGCLTLREIRQLRERWHRAHVGNDLTQPLVIPLIVEAIVAIGLFALWLAWWGALP